MSTLARPHEDLNRLRSLTEEVSSFESLYHALVVHVPFGMIVHDQNRIQYINPAGADRLGVAQDEVIGAPVELYFGDSLTREGVLTSTISGKHSIERMDGTKLGATIMELPVRINGSRYAQAIIFTDDLEAVHDE